MQDKRIKRVRERKIVDHSPFTSRPVLRVLVVMSGVIGPQLDFESDIKQLIVLADRGHQVTCLVAGTRKSQARMRGGPSFNQETVLLRKLVPVLWLVFFELMVSCHVLRSIRRYHVLVLDVHSLPSVLPFLLISRLPHRFPIVFLRIPTNPVETGGPVRSLALSFLYALAIKLAATCFDRIFFISPMLGEWYSAQLGISKNKVAVWPSSVDMNVFDPSSVKNTDLLRRELGVLDRLGVLYHGVLTKGRGIMEVVEAFKILREEHVKASLILLGDGPLRQEVLRYVATNDLEEVVQVCGPVDYSDVPEFVAACDVEIVPLPDHPWWRYQCPTKVLECLAMNKPLIVSDIPAHKWILGHAPVALYLKGTSPREIADGVLAFLARRDRFDTRLGRRLASEFSAEVLAEMLEHEMLSIVEPGFSAKA